MIKLKQTVEKVKLAGYLML